MAVKPLKPPPPPSSIGKPEPPDEPEVLKALIGFGTELHSMDVIKWSGHRWLVPTWLEAPSEGWKMPERIILLDWLRHQPLSEKGGGGRDQFLVNDPIPKEILFDPDPKPPTPQYVVHMRPNIRMRTKYLPGLH